MCMKRVAAFTAMFSVLQATATFAQDGITVTPISCVAPVMNAKVVARTPSSARSSRVYFTAIPGQPEYYVDMRPAADGSYWALLPQIEPATRSFAYRVVTFDAKARAASSYAMTATAKAACATAPSADEQRVASNLVVGKTTDSQSSVAPGFTCRGQVSFITAAGQLTPNDECRRILSSADGAQGTSAEGTGAQGTTAQGSAGQGTAGQQTGAGAAGAGASGAGSTGGAAGAGASGTAGSAGAAGAAGSGAAGSGLGGTAVAGASTEGGLSALTLGAIALGAGAAALIIIKNNDNKKKISSATP